MKIYCCECQTEVQANLIDGKEIYPHRPDLANLSFWICPTCSNYVGCHQDKQNVPKPLGSIPTKEIRAARRQVHKVLDPKWRSGPYSRREIYKYLSEKLAKEYHTAEINSVEEANKICDLLKQLD